MQLIQTAFKNIPGGFKFGENILKGFEKLDQKFSLSKLSEEEQENFFINFYRTVYFKLAKKFGLSTQWSDEIPIPVDIKKRLENIPKIDWYYLKEIEKLQKNLLAQT